MAKVETPKTASGNDVPRKPSRLWRKLARACLGVMLVLSMILGGLAMWGMGRDVPVPNWARAQIDQRLIEVIPNATVRFGDMILVVDEGWRPRVRVSNVQITDLSGAEVMAFSEVRASMAMRPLLSGQLELKSLDVTGVFASLRRDKDRQITLSYGSGAMNGSAPAARRATSVAQIITELDDLLLRPGLSALTRASVRALTLRYEDEVAGRAWTVDGGRVRLNREGDEVFISADLALLDGDAEAATLEANYSGQIGETAAEVGVSIAGVNAEDIATQSPAFAWLGALQAPISGAVRGGLDGDGGFLPLNASLQIGAGVIQPTPAAIPIPIEGARSYMSYVPQEQRLRFDELSVRSKWVSGTLEGDASLGGLDSGGLSDLVGQLLLSDLVINPRGLYPEPVTIDAAEMDFRLRLRPFELQVGRLQIEDQGQILRARGVLGADAQGWSTRVDADMDAITRERLMTLWPVGVVPKTRDWLEQNLYGGTLGNIMFALRRDADTPMRTYLGVAFEDAEVRFLKTLPVAQDASGQFTLMDDRFVLSVDQGHVAAAQGGRVQMAGSSFIIPDVRVKGGAPAVVRLNTDSSITAALSLLNQPPMRVMDKANRPVDLVEGRAVLNGTLAFDLKRGKRKDPVAYAVSGDLTDVRSDKLVPGRRFEADRLTLQTRNEEISIGGTGALDGVPFDATWTQPTGKARDGTSRVAGQIEVSPATLDAFQIALPEGMVTGAGQADLIVDIAKGQAPAFSLTSELQGVGLNIQPVNWSKAASSTGQLSVAGALGQVPTIDKLELRGPGMSALGRVSLTENGALEKLQIDRLTVGDWLDAPVDLVGRGRGQPVGVSVNGGALDLRNAKFGQNGAGSDAPLNARFDQVRLTDSIVLSDVQGAFTAAGGLDGSFTGKVNGGTEVRGTLLPQNGRTALRLRSADAGGVLSSAGVVKEVEGGAMELTMLPVGTGGAYDGRLRVTETSIQDAPIMAALLNAVSIVGLVTELSGSGIYFSDVEAAFRLAPDQITLKEASATGPSMGISMDGVFSPQTGQVDLRGVITPVYLLNGLASFMTRRGEGLLGFNYSVRGTAEAPKVRVNPFSVLAPGALRDLFRTPPPTVQLEDGEVAPEPVEPLREPALNDPALAGANAGR